MLLTNPVPAISGEGVVRVRVHVCARADACTTISDAAENAHRVFRVDKIKNNSGKEAGTVLNREGKSAGEDGEQTTGSQLCGQRGPWACR